MIAPTQGLGRKSKRRKLVGTMVFPRKSGNHKKNDSLGISEIKLFLCIEVKINL